MEESKLRALMLQNRAFLQQLYTSNSMQAKKILAVATNVQLKLICEVIHKVSCGSIAMRKDDFPLLKRAKKVNYLEKTFFSKQSLNKILRADREWKMEKLSKLASVFPILLHALFNEIEPSDSSKVQESQ